MPLTTLFTNTLTSFISLVKRSLHQYGFLALAAYDSLAALQPRWDSVHMLRSPASREANEFKDGFLSLRAVCLRSFPEFLADLKIAAMSKAGESTGLADFTLSVRQNLRHVRFEDA
jgi:exocyst complex protein 7